MATRLLKNIAAGDSREPSEYQQLNFHSISLEQRAYNVKDFGATGDGSTDDTSAIQTALTTATTGGLVFLPQGTYLISTALSLPSNVTLGGSGFGSIIKVANGANLTMAIQLATATTVNVSIRDLVLDGNKANQTAGTGDGIFFNPTGLSTPPPDAYYLIQNVQVINARKIAVNIGAYSRETRLINVSTRDSGNNGFTVFGTDCYVSSCSSSAALNYGFELTGQNTTIVNSKAFYSTLDGFIVSSDRIVISVCEAQDNSRTGFTFFSCKDVAITGCLADSNQNEGFRFDTSTYFTAQACVSITRVGGRYTQTAGYGYLGTPNFAIINGISRGNTAQKSGSLGASTTEVLWGV